MALVVGGKTYVSPGTQRAIDRSNNSKKKDVTNKPNETIGQRIQREKAEAQAASKATQEQSAQEIKDLEAQGYTAVATSKEGGVIYSKTTIVPESPRNLPQDQSSGYISPAVRRGMEEARKEDEAAFRQTQEGRFQTAVERARAREERNIERTERAYRAVSGLAPQVPVVKQGVSILATAPVALFGFAPVVAEKAFLTGKGLVLYPQETRSELVRSGKEAGKQTSRSVTFRDPITGKVTQESIAGGIIIYGGGALGARGSRQQSSVSKPSSAPKSGPGSSVIVPKSVSTGKGPGTLVEVKPGDFSANFRNQPKPSTSVLNTAKESVALSKISKEVRAKVSKPSTPVKSLSASEIDAAIGRISGTVQKKAPLQSRPVEFSVYKEVPSFRTVTTPSGRVRTVKATQEVPVTPKPLGPSKLNREVLRSQKPAGLKTPAGRKLAKTKEKDFFTRTASDEGQVLGRFLSREEKYSFDYRQELFAEKGAAKASASRIEAARQFRLKQLGISEEPSSVVSGGFGKKGSLQVLKKPVVKQKERVVTRFGKKVSRDSDSFFSPRQQKTISSFPTQSASSKLFLSAPLVAGLSVGSRAATKSFLDSRQDSFQDQKFLPKQEFRQELYRKPTQESKQSLAQLTSYSFATGAAVAAFVAPKPFSNNSLVYSTPPPKKEPFRTVGGFDAGGGLGGSFSRGGRSKKGRSQFDPSVYGASFGIKQKGGKFSSGVNPLAFRGV